MRLSKNQVGDTIVEVLLSVIVVGLAIGLAYGIASRSLRGSRQAQERVEALKLVESQIEQLKSGANKTGDSSLFQVNKVFCLVDGERQESTGYGGSEKSLQNDDLTTTEYNQACVNGNYHIGIVYQNNTFTVWARWFSVGNINKEEVKIPYRMFAQ